MNTPSILPLCAVLLMAACGGSSTSGSDPVVDPPMIIDPVLDIDPPTISNATVADFRREFSRTNNLGEQFGIAAGNATFNGAMIADATGIRGANGMVGDLTLRTALLSNAVSGAVSNLHLINGNTPIEALRGELTLTGEANGATKDMRADVKGDLNGLFGTTSRQDV